MLSTWPAHGSARVPGSFLAPGQEEVASRLIKGFHFRQEEKKMFTTAPLIVSLYFGGLGQCLFSDSLPVLSFSLAPVQLIYLKVCQHEAQMRSWASFLLTAGHANKSFFSSLAN